MPQFFSFGKTCTSVFGPFQLHLGKSHKPISLSITWVYLYSVCKHFQGFLTAVHTDIDYGQFRTVSQVSPFTAL